MKKHITNIVIMMAFFFPITVFAQGTLWTVMGVIQIIVHTLGWALPFLAFVVFFYGLGRFLLNAGDEKAAAEGRGIMTWAVLALFVLVCIIGIIGFMDRSLGTDVGPGNVQIIVPTLPG